MSNSLTDVYNQISDHDAVYLEKQAEAIKVAEEEDAAGRIMARGFADELHKLAGGFGTEQLTTKQKGSTVPVGTAKPVAAPGAGYKPQVTSRPMRGPTLPSGSATAGTARSATYSRKKGLQPKPSM